MILIILVVVIAALVVAPGMWVRSVLSKYAKPEDRYFHTGGEFAQRLLSGLGIDNVGVEVTELGEHYDPGDKMVRLSKTNFEGRSLTAITVATHEVGHAVQDACGYGPLRWRTQLVRILAPVERFAAVFMMLSPFMAIFTRIPLTGISMFVGGFLIMGLGTVVHLITLPMELDASFSRAMPILKEGGFLIEGDEYHARRILKAAAYTYVSASLMSLLNVARWWAIIRR